MKKIRCAIYTRKSAEEGLEQEFNSLDAQREACAAYVASQKAEGWVLLPTVYEDAGISGGTLERPGLQRLLDNIAPVETPRITNIRMDVRSTSRTKDCETRPAGIVAPRVWLSRNNARTMRLAARAPAD